MKMRVAAAAVGAAGGCLLLASCTGPHSSQPNTIIGTLVAAQAPTDALVHVREVADADLTSEHNWHRYQITVPVTSPPLDMHVLFFLDNKGEDIVYQRPDAWPQATPLAYRLDADDDSLVKTVFKDQGLPINQRVVTYHIESVADFYSISSHQVLKFRHGSVGATEMTGSSNLPAPVGKEVVLEDELLSEDTYHGPPGDWQQAGYVASHPLRHRLTVSVVFRPHHGPAAKGHGTITQDITRA